jgi:hypothetical protein
MSGVAQTIAMANHAGGTGKSTGAARAGLVNVAFSRSLPPDADAACALVAAFARRLEVGGGL